MNCKVFAFTLLVTITNTMNSYSQAQVVNNDVLIANERLNMLEGASEALDAVGTPYINEDFLPIRIAEFKDQIFSARYNAYNGEMEVDLGTKVIALDVSKDYLITFTLNGKKYKTFGYTSRIGTFKNGFLNIVKQTVSFSLLKEEIIKFYDKLPAKSSYHQEKPAKFERKDDIYYLKTGNSITYLPTRKKELYKTYPSKQNEIKSFIKKNKISLKQEEDIIKLAELIASL